MSFVDTNVLVYATAAGSPFHAQARAALSRLASSEPIPEEMSRSPVGVWAKALTLVEAIADTETFSRRFTVLEDGVAVWEQFVLLSRGFPFGGRQVHDANIVATMLAHGQTRLLTFNEADFRRFSSVIEIVVP